MATLSDGSFQFLSLCAPPPGSAAIAERLPSALATVPSFDELAIAAEQHGMEPLVLAHIERTGLAIPADLRARLRARRTQHAHAAAVRAWVVADVACAMAQAGVPFLVLRVPRSRIWCTAIHGSGRCATSTCSSARPTPDMRSTS
jgi:hypothetical protein